MTEEVKTKDLATKTKEAPKEGAPKKKKKKVKYVKVYQTVADAINRHPLAGHLLRFPKSYYVYEPVAGAYVVLRLTNEPGVVEIVLKSRLVSDIVKYTRQAFPLQDDFNLTHAQSEECAKYWIDDSEAIPEPKPFAWPNEDGLTFRRLPWTLAPGPTPTWDKLMGQMTNSGAFKAWVGSLFFPESYLQQYVWAYGAGNDGKGAINRFLAQVFGNAYCSKQPRDRGDKFWTYELLGKRLVVFPDCNDRDFITGSLFKCLTGADPIGVEEKGKMGFTVQLKCKFFVISNEKPCISSEKSDSRRIIYCEFKDRGDDENDPQFEANLWHEGGAFLDSCIEKYRKDYPKHGAIDGETTEISSWVETVESDFEEILDFHFEIGFEEKDKANWIPAILMQRKLNIAFPHKRKPQLDFLSWIERKHGIKKFRPNDGEGKKRHWVYKGLISKPLIDLNADQKGGTSPQDTSYDRSGQRSW